MTGEQEQPKVLSTRLGTWYGPRRPAMKAHCPLKKARHFCFNECPRK